MVVERIPLDDLQYFAAECRNDREMDEWGMKILAEEAILLMAERDAAVALLRQVDMGADAASHRSLCTEDSNCQFHRVRAFLAILAPAGEGE